MQLIKAEDSGGLSSTATVNIRVTDINDENPKFEGLPYEFMVKEGETRKLIGRVHAEDADEGINAVVTYFAPDDVPFTVDRSLRILPVVKFQTSMKPSTEPVTRNCPSGEKRAHSTCDFCPNLICFDNCVGYFSSS